DENRERANSRCRIEVAAPAAQVDSGEDKFVAAGLDEAPDVIEHRSSGEAPRMATRLRNDAEGATVRAAFLDLQVGSRLCAGRDWRFFEERMSEGVIGEDNGLV